MHKFNCVYDLMDLPTDKLQELVGQKVVFKSKQPQTIESHSFVIELDDTSAAQFSTEYTICEISYNNEYSGGKTKSMVSVHIFGTDDFNFCARMEGEELTYHLVKRFTLAYLNHLDFSEISPEHFSNSIQKVFEVEIDWN